MALGDDILGTALPVPAKADDFEGDGLRILGFQYHVESNRLVGNDPERPGLGTVVVPILGGKITDAKIALMWRLCGGLTSAQQASRIFFGSAPAQNGISVSAVPARTSGVAPLTVFFDASLTTSTDTAYPFHHCFYEWDFNDPTAGNWQDTKAGAVTLSKNRALGPMAAHVFETPGTYNVTLTVTNMAGETAQQVVQIVVDDPDVVFAGASTVVVSPTGTFTGAPAGATQVTSGDFGAMLTAHLAAGKRVLFRRGETFTMSAGHTIVNTGPWHVGAFGTGARPIVELNFGGSAFSTSQNDLHAANADGRIADLDFDGNSNAGTMVVRGLGGYDQLTVLRVRLHHASQLYEFYDGNIGVANGGNPGANLPGDDGPHYVWDQVAVVDCQMENQTSTPLMSTERLFFAGNNINAVGAAAHVVRMASVWKGVISHNIIEGGDTTRHTLTVRGPCRGFRPATNACYHITVGRDWTEQVVISDNKLNGGYNQFTMRLQPTDTNVDERIRNVIVERNWIDQDVNPGTNAALWAFGIEADLVTARNNLWNLSGASARGAVRLGPSVPGQNFIPVSDTVWVHNNTAFASDNGGFVMLNFSDQVTNVEAENNLAYAPADTQHAFDGGTAGAGYVASNNSTEANGGQIDTVDPFVSPTPVNPLDFRISAGSYANGGGAAGPVFDDFFGNRRNATRDIGAHAFNVGA